MTILAPTNGNGRGTKHRDQTPAQLISLTAVGADGILTKPRGLTSAFYKKVREMRRDPTIKLARWFAVAPLLNAEWSYEQTKDAPEGARDAVQETFDDLRLDLLRTSQYGWIDYGWQPYERIYDYCEKDGLVKPRLKPLLQDMTDILVIESSGDYAGLQQDPTTGMTVVPVILNTEESLVVYYDEEGTNWYGEPVMKALEAIYDESLGITANARKYDKRVAGAHWVIYYPLGVSNFDGEERDNGEIATTILRSIESMGGVAIPRSIVAGIDSLNIQAAAGLDALCWKVELLSDHGAGQTPFLDRLSYLDKLKVRAFGFPERAMLEGQFGTKAEAEAHADLAIMNLETRHRCFCQFYNRGGGGQTGLVNQFLQFNYGADAVDAVWINPAPIADRALDFIKKIYELWFANPQGFMEEMTLLDKKALRQRVGLPVVDEPEMLQGDAWQQDMGYMDAAAGEAAPLPEALSLAWDEAAHPRDPGGEDGGQFVEKGDVDLSTIMKYSYKGAYLDTKTIKVYNRDGTKHSEFMKAWLAALDEKGLALKPLEGQTLVHSPRGGGKFGKAKGYRIVEKPKDTSLDWSDQPRVPAGVPEGGEWTDAGGMPSGWKARETPKGKEHMSPEGHVVPPHMEPVVAPPPPDDPNWEPVPEEDLGPGWYTQATPDGNRAWRAPDGTVFKSFAQAKFTQRVETENREFAAKHGRKPGERPKAEPKPAKKTKKVKK